jgi:hypothetical protein
MTDTTDAGNAPPRPAIGTVWIRASTDATRQALLEAADAEQVPCLLIEDEDELARRLTEATPSALLVEHAPPDSYAPDVLDLLRAAPRPAAPDHETRLIVVAQPEAAERLQHIGATEVLEAPLGHDFLRAHMKGWSTRRPVHWRRGTTPANEERRLTALRGLGILDTPPEERFDRIARIARTALDVPIVLVSLIDEGRQWFKSCHGLEVAETPRDVAFCAHAVTHGSELIVPDARADERFADNPLVTGAPGIRFYAGVPLSPEPGLCIGTLCVIDLEPRELGDRDMELLRDLRDLVERELQLTPERAS